MKINQVIIACIIILSTMPGCKKSKSERKSIEYILGNEKQDLVFRSLIQICGDAIPRNIWNDSLAFLILPIQASCPSCRNKTIDSIVQHQYDLRINHFIIISANSGRKNIAGYFLENNKVLPEIKNSLFLDTTNRANQFELYDKKPTIYYTYNQKAYKKVAAIPATVRDDLHEFFSGYLNEKQLIKK